ncbi:NAD(P)/FAD-dependent oxidoreductase [Streptomyces alfalfae]|uniref:Phytoene dehydrogenase n=1 Tax=Streptomyces alfalfae TaxID=1642299 RepID=A0ABN4VK99_9ACTN|nr:phytoene dehydrogenase [Streptomyces alfalfae]AYA17513.1 NAD(P)/FAD-dependent oxidoreductase [Streptomyces fradiae]RXX44561.1 NAD(P)/FAD-dependent oxidoreductase [Streptomyces alfalfae]RZN05337.1 NAD(P)/FAD-dependent oxidoreductase [Streptomyces alfalfae]
MGVSVGTSRTAGASAGGPAGRGHDYDAIVVGSGIGGLVSGGYLAADGRRVLVLEQHDIAGGNAHVFRRRRKYEFDVGTHYLGDCGPDGLIPAVLSGLGIRDRVTFRPMDNEGGFDRVVTPTTTVDVPAGWDNYRERLKQALPDEAAGIDEFIDLAKGVTAMSRAGLLGEPMVHLFRRSPQTMRWSRRTLGQALDHCGLSRRARTVLAAQSGNYGAMPDEIGFAEHVNIMDHYLRGAYYPEGGGQALVAAFVEALEAYGGELRTRCEVRRILIEDGRARGVELGTGERIMAPLVISNADYRRTVLDLCGGTDAFPEELVTQTREATMRGAVVAVYVALDTELPGLPNANIWWHDSDDMEGSHAAMKRGEFERISQLAFSFASLKDAGAPNVCPPGHSNFQLMTGCPPGYEFWGAEKSPVDGERYRRNPGYLARKQQMQEMILDAAEKVIGPFRDRITHVETATPLTNERYIRASGGTPYGMCRWGAVGQRPDVRTGVEGLYVVGQSVRYGSGVGGVATGGIACASHILGRGLLAEVFDGTVLGDAGLLPERADGWDPLMVSRGRSRQRAKGLARIG